LGRVSSSLRLVVGAKRLELRTTSAQKRLIERAAELRGTSVAIPWDMIDDDNVLRMPGLLTKNGQPYSLALTNRKGAPYKRPHFMVNMKTRPDGESVFDTTSLREECECPAIKRS
jgi:uncharacterized protein DUF1778